MATLPSVTFSQNCNNGDHVKSVGGDLGYKSRGQVCEGLYESKISADFELVSLLFSPLPSFHDKAVLTVIAPKVANSLFRNGVKVTALSLKPRLYYRMDADVNTKTELAWPVNEVISKIELNYQNIGLFGWASKSTDIVYTPLYIRLDNEIDDADTSQMIHAVVRAGVNVETFVWRILADNLRSEAHLTQTRYAAGSPIRFKFEPPQITGDTYKIQLDAKPENSDDWLTQTLSIAISTNRIDIISEKARQRGK